MIPQSKTACASITPSNFTLEELGIVDAETPEAFDALTRLAMKLLDVPVALISIVQEDLDRQYFTSQQGLAEPWASRRETPLSHSFCQHVKQTNKPLIVPDSRHHPKVCQNLAIDDLGVVAYLGVPITAPNDEPIGALCVIQGSEREWTDDDLSILTDFARCVNDEILLRASLAAQATDHQRMKRYTALRDRISLAFMVPDLPMEERFCELLFAGREVLGLDTGLIAKVACTEAEILFSSHADMADHPADRLSLEGSFAELVVAGEKQICFHDVANSAARDRRTFDQQRAGCYVGTPLIYDGVLYGVLELSDASPRAKPWSEEDLSIISIISMFICANLGVYRRIETLQKSEEALLRYLIDRNHSPGRQAAAKEPASCSGELHI